MAQLFIALLVINCIGIIAIVIKVVVDYKYREYSQLLNHKTIKAIIGYKDER